MSIRKITVSIAAAALVGAGAILAAPAAAQADPCPEGVYATADGGLTVYGCVDGARSVPLDGGGYWVAQPGTTVPVYSDTGQVGTATVTAGSVEIISTAGADVPIWATIPAGVIVCGPTPEPEPTVEPTTEPTADPTADPTSEPTAGPSTVDAPAAPATTESTSEPASASEATTPAPEASAPAADRPAGLPATGGGTVAASLLVAGGVAALGVTAYALARTARRADDLADETYRARRGIDEEAAA
ncbi:hypothetical protein [Propionibacterium australiense]|uniref:Uncharacterized protein n=1 Tax=Propionibacterium australiense TaxID=119981 RepID=A0A8B3GHV8_9ACTN|nr:hypothetical protein [Propionibacterium australiense]RLP12235.1 hypothetical protein D7U36_02965 [Propionibacterium australiense]